MPIIINNVHNISHFSGSELNEIMRLSQSWVHLQSCQSCSNSATPGVKFCGVYHFTEMDLPTRLSLFVTFVVLHWLLTIIPTSSISYQILYQPTSKTDHFPSWVGCTCNFQPVIQSPTYFSYWQFSFLAFRIIKVIKPEVVIYS